MEKEIFKYPQESQHEKERDPKLEAFKRRVEELLDSKRVIALAESAHGEHSDVLKAVLECVERIDAIFFELPVDYQDSVEHYLKTGEFKEDMQQLIAGAQKEGQDLEHSFRVVFDAVREAEKKIICMDSSKTRRDDYTKESPYNEKYFLKGDSRDEDMAESILESVKNEGRAFVIGGANHLGQGTNQKIDRPSLGQKLKDELGEDFFSIILTQKNSEDPEEVKEVKSKFDEEFSY